MSSKEKIEEIANCDDYDRMLDCQRNQIKEIKSLRKKYFAGNMTDKEMNAAIEEISAKYAPVNDRLSKASADGELNYKQHKMQMRYAGELIKEINKVMERLSEDFADALDS